MTQRYIRSCLQLHACVRWSSHIKCYPLFCLLLWKNVLSWYTYVCLCVCVCLLMFCIMLHCLHHVDFLRIVQSWISTNGRHWHMKKRSGDLHQHDAAAADDDDDEGTIWWNKLNVQRWTWRLDETAADAKFWKSSLCSTFGSQCRCLTAEALDLYNKHHSWTLDLGHLETYVSS